MEATAAFLIPIIAEAGQLRGVRQGSQLSTTVPLKNRSEVHGYHAGQLRGAPVLQASRVVRRREFDCTVQMVGTSPMDFMENLKKQLGGAPQTNGSQAAPASVVAVASENKLIDTFNKAVMNTYIRYPLVIVRGEGCKLWDDKGKEYLDFVAGIATCSLGHAHPELTAAVAKQMATVNHVSNLYYIPVQAELASFIINHSIADRVFFCNSGAEANEGAIKLARKYAHTKLNISNPVIITAHASFHGRTLATITATGQPKYQKDFEPLMPGFRYVEYNNVEDLEKVVAEVNKDGPCLAGIMMEALQGEGGVRPGEKAFFKKARELCDATGALLIFDEVQVGVGRTGTLWGYENVGVEPDVFTTAKGLGGGVPIGMMACKERCDVLTPGTHASTFGGNPLACAAAMCVLTAIERDNILANVAARGEQLRAGLGKLIQKYPAILKEVRGWGLINGLELAANCGVQSGDVVGKASELGLLLVPAGPTVVRFVPPLIVTAADVDKALAIVDAALASFPTK